MNSLSLSCISVSPSSFFLDPSLRKSRRDKEKGVTDTNKTTAKSTQVKTQYSRCDSIFIDRTKKYKVLLTNVVRPVMEAVEHSPKTPNTTQRENPVSLWRV
jgi:hypothetical protein